MDFDRLRFVSERADSSETLISVTIPERPGAFQAGVRVCKPDLWRFSRRGKKLLVLYRFFLRDYFCGAPRSTDREFSIHMPFRGCNTNEHYRLRAEQRFHYSATEFLVDSDSHREIPMGFVA